MTANANEIFYVDDSPDDVFLAHYHMRDGQFGFTLKTFNTGIAAILDMERRVRRGEALPRMLVADFYMPITDGPELLRLISANESLSSVALSICSGSDDPRDRQIAEEAGARLFLLKPLDLAFCQSLLEIDDRAAAKT